jgi:hypothetical protein
LLAPKRQDVGRDDGPSLGWADAEARTPRFRSGSTTTSTRPRSLNTRGTSNATNEEIDHGEGDEAEGRDTAEDRLVDRLNDIAERIRVAGLPVEGAIAACDSGVLGPVQYFISELARGRETVAHEAE